MLLRAAARPESQAPSSTPSTPNPPAYSPPQLPGETGTPPALCKSVLARLSLKGPAEGDRHRVRSQLPDQTPGCSALATRLWVPARCPTLG